MYNMEWGVCVPDVCTKEDVSKNFEFLFNNGKNCIVVRLNTLTITVALKTSNITL